MKSITDWCEHLRIRLAFRQIAIGGIPTIKKLAGRIVYKAATFNVVIFLVPSIGCELIILGFFNENKRGNNFQDY